MTNLNVDLGENVLHLLEEFSKTIGTTADKVFPWFVNDQLICGYVSLITPLIIMLICFILIKSNLKKTDWEDMNLNGGIVVACSTISAIAFMVFTCSLPSSLSSILNPQYGAIKNLIYTLSRFVN